MDVWIIILTAPFVWFLISRLISKSQSYFTEAYEWPWLEIIMLSIHYVAFIHFLIFNL